MRLVVDTNVLISGVFFGGFPRQILNALVESRLTACATTEIIDEYEEIVQEMIDRKQGHINRQLLAPLVQALEVVEPVTHVELIIPLRRRRQSGILSSNCPAGTAVP